MYILTKSLVNLYIIIIIIYILLADPIPIIKLKKDLQKRGCNQISEIRLISTLNSVEQFKSFHKLFNNCLETETITLDCIYYSLLFI